MNVLMISTDRNIFKQSSVRERMIEYGKILGNLNIIIFSTENHETESISPEVKIYSTNSSSKISYINDAVKIAEGIDGVEIVSAQDPFETGLAAQRISKDKKIKLHLQIHTDLFSPSFKKSSILNRVRVGIAKRILPKADGVRVVSKRIKDSLSKLKLKSEPFVLPIFSDSEKFYTNNEVKTFDKYDKVIMSVSRLESEKNVDFILDVFADLNKEDKKMGLIIVGEGSKKDVLEKRCNKLGIIDNVDFVGEISSLAPYYKGADVYFQASSYEGFGLALFEAALSGLSIVSTNVGLVGSVLKDEEAVLVTYLNKKNAVKQIKRLLDNENLRNSLGNNARESAKKYLISKEEYLEKYKKSLEI